MVGPLRKGAISATFQPILGRDHLFLGRENQVLCREPPVVAEWDETVAAGIILGGQPRTTHSGVGPMSFAALRMSGMPKALCIAGMVVAVLVAILFILDLAVPSMMFRGASMLMDIVMIVCSIILAVISWLTLKEQK